MATNKYLKAISAPGDSAAVSRDMTREEIERAIAEIGDALKGPMSNTERALLVLDRKDLRARLAELAATPCSLVVLPCHARNH